MMSYYFMRGRTNVHYLTASYDRLVAAFGNDGTVTPRDEDKVTTSWDVPTPHGVVEIYDYHPIGTIDTEPNRSSITAWHVQGSDAGIRYALSLIGGACGEDPQP